jgi:DNA-binding transcriptional LysR family regulator
MPPSSPHGTLPTSTRLAFGLSSEQCELLVAFESAGSLGGLARVMGKDVSVISRQLQRLARAAAVLEKRQGKWRLTPLGRQINGWTRDVATSQRRILQQQTMVRIASTREFGARVLAPHLDELRGPDDDAAVLSIVASEEGVERVLLAGNADLGFDCGRPEDPSLRFKTVKPEEFAVLASPEFLTAHRFRSPTELLELPHLQYQRASAHRLLQLTYEVPHIFAVFNDIASIREACLAGLGWAVLPVYAVRRELDAESLKRISGWNIQQEQFGVWWVRGQTSIEPWVKRAIAWLGMQSLGS